MASVTFFKRQLFRLAKHRWLVFTLLTAVGIVVIPSLNAFTEPNSAIHVPQYFITLLGKFLCFAMVALALDMLWGYCGILSLGHGVFFAFGSYLMGMHLMRASAGQGVYRSELPDFMVFLDWKELPWYWWGFESPTFTALMIILVPAMSAFLFGYFAFRSRIKDVYFAIMTQAMTYALMLLFFRNETGFGGENGLTDFKQFLGMSLHDGDTKLLLFILSVFALLLTYLTARYVVRSRVGLVLRAIRDSEEKVRFQGYNSIHFKLFVWVLSAVICGIAGALYAPQVGIINPSEMKPAKSIEMAIWVAVGGRGTLVGAMLGAGVVNALKSFCTAWYPDLWLFVLGGLFVVVTVWLPGGLVDFARAVRILRGRTLSYVASDDFVWRRLWRRS